MNTINGTLLDCVKNLDNVARIAALRGITNSAMAKCIGAIRQDIRDKARAERNDDNPQTDIDVRNSFDEDNRSGDDVKEAMGFQTQIPPLRLASLYHAVYDWAASDLKMLSTSMYDEPLNLKQMLDYMTKSAQPLDNALVKALAKAAHTTEDAIRKLHELQHQREREQLIEATPEIVYTFNGFGDNGYETAVEDLPKVAQHQLGVKVVESLNKARDNVLQRVMRSRKISDLGSIPLIEEGINAVSEWVENFEKRNGDELREAIDAGRNLRTLEDVATL